MSPLMWMAKHIRNWSGVLLVQGCWLPSQTRVLKNVIEAETRWAVFVAKHNLAFLASDHASKLFATMFPDSQIAKKFSCGRTKTTAIVKGALAPHFLNTAISNMSSAFSLLMDESNDKTNKSCIILVRMLDPDIGDCRTRFFRHAYSQHRHSCQPLFCLESFLRKEWTRLLQGCGFYIRHHKCNEGCSIWRSKVDQKWAPSSLWGWLYMPLGWPCG